MIDIMDIIFFQIKYNFLKKKNLKFFLGIWFILLIYLVKIKYYFVQYDLNGNLTDYMIFSIGGWESPILFTSLLDWSFLVFLTLCMSITMSSNFEKINSIILNRVGSKGKFWMYICVNELFFCFLITFLVFIFSLIIGICFLGYSTNVSEYTKIFYKDLSNIGFYNLMIYIFIVFFTGIYLLQIMIRAFVCFFYNVNIFYVIFLIICIFSGFLFVYFKIPKILSPLFYPSLMLDDSFLIYMNIFRNLIMTILFMIIGYFTYLNRDVI